MTPFEAIFQRQSIRHFRKDPVPETVLHKIENFEAELIPIFPYVKMETKVYRAEEYHSKMPALFGVQALLYLAVYAQTLEGSRSNAGNLLEQIALYLHSRASAPVSWEACGRLKAHRRRRAWNLSSCWLSVCRKES